MAKSIRQAIEDLTGKPATDLQIQRLMAAANALGIRQDDGMVLLLMVLEHYLGLFDRAPDRIEASVDASIAAVKTSAALSTEQAQASINAAVAGLVPSVEKAVAKAAGKAIERIRLGQSFFTLWLGLVALGIAFAFGWMGGAHLFSYLQEDRISAASFWNSTGWGLGTGLAAPALIVLAVYREDDTQRWLLFAMGSALTAALVYNLVRP